MQKLKVDKKTIFYLSFYAVLIINFLIIVPFQVKKFSQARVRLVSTTKELIQFEKDSATGPYLVEEKEALLSDILTLEEKIITAQDISAISADISNKAKEYGVKIIEISSATHEKYRKTSQEEYFYLPITINAEAPFHNSALFLNALERGRYFLEINELAIQESAPYHSVRIVLNTLLKE